MPQKIFKTFPKFRIFFLWIFSPKVFQDCFLSYCIKSFPKLRKKFPQISRIYQNFFYQTSKLFRKNTEIPKLFRYDYIQINGNIHPWYYMYIKVYRYLYTYIVRDAVCYGFCECMYHVCVCMLLSTLFWSGSAQHRVLVVRPRAPSSL